MNTMSDVILVYIPCESETQAQRISRHLMKKRLVACTNIFPHMHSRFFWPAKSGKVEEAHETVLLAKTIQSKWELVEQEVLKIHSYDTPCILAIPTTHVTQKYYDWLIGELRS